MKKVKVLLVGLLIVIVTAIVCTIAGLDLETSFACTKDIDCAGMKKSMCRNFKCVAAKKIVVQKKEERDCHSLSDPCPCEKDADCPDDYVCRIFSCRQQTR